MVGCGAMGAAAGWRLAERGAEVVCFDRHSPPHALGSSHGETRITRTAYFEGAWYVPLLLETFPMWRALEKATGAELLTVTGLLTLGALDSPPIVGALAAAREHRQPTQVLDAPEARRLYPAHVVDDHDVVVVDPQAGFVRPEAAIVAMLQQLDVRRDQPVGAITPTGEGVDVTTAAGRESFDAVVVAAGTWARELLPFLPVTVERQVTVWLEIEPHAEQFAPERFPVYFRETTALGDIYGFPTLDGRTVKLARHHGGETTDPHRIRREVDDADLDPLRTFATQIGRASCRERVCVPV